MIYLDLFFTFLKIGLFTFGGGYAMLPLVQQAATEHGWMNTQEIVNFIAVSESSPGPFAINMATYIGSSVGGILGAFCATFGVVLPSFVIILIVAKCYIAFRQNRWVNGVMTGLRPAVVGLIGASMISVALQVFFPAGISLSFYRDYAFWIAVAIFLLMVLLQRKKLHPILIILLSALLGIGSQYLREIRF